LLLQNRGKLAKIFDKNKDKLKELVKLNDYLETNHIDMNKAWNSFDLKKRISDLQLENQGLNFRYSHLSDLNKYWQFEVQKAYKRYQALLKSVKDKCRAHYKS